MIKGWWTHFKDWLKQHKKGVGLSLFGIVSFLIGIFVVKKIDAHAVVHEVIEKKDQMPWVKDPFDSMKIHIFDTNNNVFHSVKLDVDNSQVKVATVQIVDDKPKPIIVAENKVIDRKEIINEASTLPPGTESASDMLKSKFPKLFPQSTTKPDVPGS